MKVAQKCFYATRRHRHIQYSNTIVAIHFMQCRVLLQVRSALLSKTCLIFDISPQWSWIFFSCLALLTFRLLSAHGRIAWRCLKQLILLWTKAETDAWYCKCVSLVSCSGFVTLTRHSRQKHPALRFKGKGTDQAWQSRNILRATHLF